MAGFLILASTVTHMAESLFIKKYNTKHGGGGFIFTALVSFFSMLFFLIRDQNSFTAPLELWWYAIAAGILYCTASLLTYVALQIGSYAMTMLILSYSILMSIGYGLVFLKEQITVFMVFGLLLMMVSIYLVRAKKSESEKEQRGFSLKWLVCVSAAAVGSGLFGVVQRMQQIRFENGCTNEFMIIALSFSAVVLMLVGVCGKDRKDFSQVMRHGSLWAAGAGISNGLTNASVVFLHLLMPISLSSPIRVGLKILLSFLLSVFILKESFQKRQVYGVALGTLALILLNIR